MSGLIIPPTPFHDDDEPAPNPLPGKCPACIYAKQLSSHAATKYEGVCRRYPPAPIMLGMAASNVRGGSPQPVVQEFWPNVYAEWTCGEFKPIPSMKKMDS